MAVITENHAKVIAAVLPNTSPHTPILHHANSPKLQSSPRYQADPCRKISITCIVIGIFASLYSFFIDQEKEPLPTICLSGGLILSAIGMIRCIAKTKGGAPFREMKA